MESLKLMYRSSKWIQWFKINERNKRLDNYGFSLLELLISIVILVIVMIPLMSNFFRSAKLNEKAASLQEYNNVATNIVEQMKSMNLDETSGYAGLVQLEKQTDSYREHLLSDINNDGIYYFGMNGITEGDTTYDALITIDADTNYETAVENDAVALMNKYEMPDINTLDNTVNGLFLSNMFIDTNTNSLSYTEDPLNPTDKSLEDKVIDEFVLIGETFADKQFKANSELYSDYLKELREIQNGKVAPIPAEPTRAQDANYAHPDYCNPNYVGTWISRTFDIMVRNEIDHVGKPFTMITYQITYHCNWPVSILDNEITYVIESRSYNSFINNVYLFYKSINLNQNSESKRDIINITYNTDEDILHFYLVKDKYETTDPFIKINRNKTNIYLYTDMSDTRVKASDDGSDLVMNEIVTTQKKDRIYSITVDIYKYTEGAVETKYKEVDKLYTLQSNRGD